MFRKCLKNTVRTTQSAIRKEEGLTLLEAAIGLVLIGLITLPLIQKYKVDLIQESWDRTRGSLANTENAINQFYTAGNFDYPCPANLSLKEGDANFGESGDCLLANLKLCTNPTWLTSEGICKTEDTTNAVVIGGGPFATLKMQQEKALDFWGNKIIYAVTLEQTEEATFLTNNGTIRVEAVDSPQAIKLRIENGTAPQLVDDGIPNEKTNSVDFFLFSTGITGVGGYTKDGVALQACGGAVTGFEHENCDLDGIFFYDQNPTDDEASAYSEVLGPNFFDDMTRAQPSLPEQMWFQHPNHNPYLITMSTRIGIGTATPQATIEVIGNIRTNGRLQSDQLCDETGSDCFDPELITGTMDAMECDSAGNMEGSQAVMQIAESQVYCNSAVYSATGAPIDGLALEVDTAVIATKICPVGQIVSGVNASGEIICVIP